MKQIGTLSTLGFIADSIEQGMDKHFAYWLAAKNSQGMSLKDTPSFDYVLMLNDGNATALRRAVEASLATHFKTVFSESYVTVKSEGIDNERDGKIKLIISVTVVENKSFYDLVSALNIAGRSYELIQEGRINAIKRA